PAAPRFECQEGIEVYYPRFLAVPWLLRQLDGASMALGSFLTLRRLKHRLGANIIDAHFAYPNGYAATLLGRWLKLPVPITMRGTEAAHLRDVRLRPRVLAALARAARVFTVSNSLRQLAIGAGVAEDRIRIVQNGVDLEKFAPLPRDDARRRLGLPLDA